jgi:hypothetical protein
MLTRWMAVLFAAGSLCFVVAPFPGFVQLVGAQADAAVFFAGSVLFTLAATLQCLGSHRRIDVWGSAVQLVGTLFFNVTTFRAMSTAVSSSSYDTLVWRPDAYGSTCFLVAGCLAYVAVAGRLLSRPPATLDGGIATINLFGCVAFAVAAAGAWVLPTTGSPANVTIANLNTALGALAFLVGALLLLPRPAAAASRLSRGGGRGAPSSRRPPPPRR